MRLRVIVYIKRKIYFLLTLQVSAFYTLQTAKIQNLTPKYSFRIGLQSQGRTYNTIKLMSIFKKLVNQGFLICNLPTPSGLMKLLQRVFGHLSLQNDPKNEYVHFSKCPLQKVTSYFLFCRALLENVFGIPNKSM